MRILGINTTLSFTRRPKPEEEAGLRSTVNEAYNALGNKERIVITHGSCFPASSTDTYIGSPYGKAAEEYTKFLMLYGFNGNQLGPIGELEHNEDGVLPSPYNSSAFAKNRLFIDLESLTTDDYANILPKDLYKIITSKPTLSVYNFSKTNFERAEAIYDIALKESYKNFKVQIRKKEPKAIKLAKEYNDFITKNSKRLTEEGVFKVLSKEYGTDDFTSWNNSTDEDLIRLVNSNNKEALKRIDTILQNNKNEIDLYKFEQFIATKQIKENKKWRDKQQFKYVNDLLVGCSKMDYWRYRDAFIDGFQLGSYEGENNNPQTWDIPVLNPRKLFKDDGLGIAGQFLKDKLDFALEFCENIRIDHVMGLIEPFVIENKSIVFDERKNVVNDPNKNPINGKYISHMQADNKPLDDYKNYSCEYVHSGDKKTFHSNVMNKIVIPTLQEHGIDPKDAIWEDLCSRPEAFCKVFYEDLKLPGIAQLEFGKVQGNSPDYWYLIGSHDSIPAQKMIKRKWTKESPDWDPLYLAGYLNMDPKRALIRDAFCSKIATNDRALVNAKFAELLTTKKFQINFADLLGITETTYNIAGTKNSTNWRERISANYIDQYYKNLSSDNPTALNIPQLLKTALQAKIDMKVVSSDNPDETRKILNEKYQPLLNELQKYTDILKEPE